MRLQCTFAPSGEQFSVEVRGHDTVGALRKVLAARVGADARALVVETCSASLRPELRESGAMLLDEDGVTLVDCLMRDGDLVRIAVGAPPSPAPAASCEREPASSDTAPAPAPAPAPASAPVAAANDSVVGAIVERDVVLGDDDDDSEDDDDDESDDDEHAPLRGLGGRAFPEAPAVRPVRDAPRPEVRVAPGAAEPVLRAPLAAANDVSETERRQIEAENTRRVEAMSASERADAVAEIRSVLSDRALESLRMLRDKRLKAAQQQQQQQQRKQEETAECEDDHEHEHEHDHEMTRDEWEKIQQDNQRIVDGMSAEERAKAIADIRAAFSPEMLEKMRQMRATAVAPSAAAEPPAQQTQPPAAREERVNNSSSNSNPLQEWMADAPPTEDTRPVAQIPTAELRFDFAGAVVPPGTDVPVRAGLHHHGGDQWAAGYTLAELCHLSRSTFPAQRVVALTTLARILARARAGAYDARHGDLGDLLCDRLLLVPLLRMAVADVNTNVRAAGVAALHALVVDPAEQHLRAELAAVARGDELYSMTAGYTSTTPEDEEREELEGTAAAAAAQNEDDGDEDEDEDEDQQQKQQQQGRRGSGDSTAFLLDQFLRRRPLLALAMLVRNDDHGTPVAMKADVLDVLERLAVHSRGAAARVARDAQVVAALYEQVRCTRSYALLARVLRVLGVLCKSTRAAALAVLGDSAHVAALAARAQTLLVADAPTVQPAFFACQAALCDLVVLARRVGVAVLDDAALAAACARLVAGADVLPRRTVFRLVAACARLVALPPAPVAAVVDTALDTLARASQSTVAEARTLDDVAPTLEALHVLWALVRPPARTDPARVGRACLAFVAAPGFHALALATFRPVAFAASPGTHTPSQQHLRLRLRLRCLPGLLDAHVPCGLADGTYGAQLAAASCVAYAADILRVTAAADTSVRDALARAATAELGGVLPSLAASIAPPAPAHVLAPGPVRRYLQRPLEQARLAVLRLLAAVPTVPRAAYAGAAAWAVADASPGDEAAVHAVLRDTLLGPEALQELADAAASTSNTSPAPPTVVAPADASETLLALADHVLTPAARTRAAALATEAALTSTTEGAWQSLFVCLDDATQAFLPLARDWPLLFLRLADEHAAAARVACAALQHVCWLAGAPRGDLVPALGAPVWAARVLEVAVLPCFRAGAPLVAWLLPRLLRDAGLRATLRAFAPSRSTHATALELVQHFLRLFASDSFGDPLMAAIVAFFLQPDDGDGETQDDDKDDEDEDKDSKAQQGQQWRWDRNSGGGKEDAEEDVADEVRACVWRTVPHLLHLVAEERVRAYNGAFRVAALWAHPAPARSRTHRAVCDALKDGRMLRARTSSALYWAAVHQLAHTLFAAAAAAATPFAVAAALGVLPARTCADVVLLPLTPTVPTPAQLVARGAHWDPDPARLALLAPALVARCRSALDPQ